MTWEILTGLITLAGALIGAAKIISNNTRAMTEIRCTVEALHTSFEQQREEIEDLHDDVSGLSTRVLTLEHQQKEKN